MAWKEFVEKSKFSQEIFRIISVNNLEPFFQELYDIMNEKISHVINQLDIIFIIISQKRRFNVELYCAYLYNQEFLFSDDKKEDKIIGYRDLVELKQPIDSIICESLMKNDQRENICRKNSYIILKSFYCSLFEEGNFVRFGIKNVESRVAYPLRWIIIYEGDEYFVIAPKVFISEKKEYEWSFSINSSSE